MTLQGLSFRKDFELEICYKSSKIGTRRVDFFVADKIMVEIKAAILLEDVHLAQAINYLEVSKYFHRCENKPTGGLLRFGNF